METILTLGDKVPLEVREMRNHVKKLSSSSFGNLAEQHEQGLSAEEHDIMIVGFLVNKISTENAEDIFEELKKLAPSSQILSEVIIDKMMEKCEMEFDMIEFYSSFLCRFMSIKKT